VKPTDVPEGPLLVDTDVFSYLYSAKDRCESFRPLLRGHLLCMSFATYGEAMCLGHQRRWGETRMNELRQALRQFVVLPYDNVVAERWAPMHVKLRGHLHDGGTNDLWTAACAMAQPQPLPIVTNNLSDFLAIAEHFPLRLVHPDLEPGV
jgi:predicted nucleic acid-binding protein